MHFLKFMLSSCSNLHYKGDSEQQQPKKISFSLRWCKFLY